MRSASIARFVRISNLLILFVASLVQLSVVDVWGGDVAPVQHSFASCTHIGTFCAIVSIEAQFLSFGADASVTEYEMKMNSV